MALEEFTPDETNEALPPIASLISKSRKAQAKLLPGTWQHTMLQGNIRALNLAYLLMSGEANTALNITKDEYQESLQSLASMIEKSEASQVKFSPGTSQHSLLRNRIKALYIAEALISAAWITEVG